MLSTEVMEAPSRQRGIARISAAFDVDERAWLGGVGLLPAAVDYRGIITMLMVTADGACRRRAPRFVHPIGMEIAPRMLRGRPSRNQHGAPRRRASNR